MPVPAIPFCGRMTVIINPSAVDKGKGSPGHDLALCALVLYKLRNRNPVTQSSSRPLKPCNLECPS